MWLFISVSCHYLMNFFKIDQFILTHFNLSLPLSPSDEKGCYDCEEVLKELERIDDDADNLDIMFVKIRDPRYARKYGITNFPALVFFRKRFPSMYRGKLEKQSTFLGHLQNVGMIVYFGFLFLQEIS